MNSFETPHYESLLRSELVRRRKKNPKYSLRAFARSLGTDPATLSRTLSGKRALGVKTARNIAERLNLNATQTKIFIASLVDGRKRALLSRHCQREKEEALSIDNDLFNLIGDWYHYAIRELSATRGFLSNERWIARQLRITVDETHLALKRMLRFGLMSQRDGKWLRGRDLVTTKDQTRTSEALRRHQKQLLKRAIHSLEEDEITERNITGITMAIDPAKLPEACLRIARFRRELCEFLESGERKRVYQLSVCLFPLQRGQG